MLRTFLEVKIFTFPQNDNLKNILLRFLTSGFDLELYHIRLI